MQDARLRAIERQLQQKGTDELRGLRRRLRERARTKAEMDQLSAIDAELNRRAA